MSTEELPRGHRIVEGRKAISMSSFAGSWGGEVAAQHPWPADTFLQGGERGVVLGREGTTAFVEAHNEGMGFIRGEGATWQEAEDAAWTKAQRALDCARHEWEPRGYINGAGICKNCGRFGSKVFTPEELGLFCAACGEPTFWHLETADPVGDFVTCEKHVPHREGGFCFCPPCQTKFDESHPTASEMTAALDALLKP